MLLKNQSRIITALEIELVFDNGTEKKTLVSEGDLVNITYRRNIRKEQHTGRIQRIECAYQYPGSRISTAVLVMDFSGDFAGLKVKIPVEDVLDIELINATEDTDNLAFHLGIGNNRIGRARLGCSSSRNPSNCHRDHHHHSGSHHHTDHCHDYYYEEDECTCHGYRER